MKNLRVDIGDHIYETLNSAITIQNECLDDFLIPRIGVGPRAYLKRPGRFVARLVNNSPAAGTIFWIPMDFSYRSV